MARTWTAEITVSDIRFNVLSPGPIETPIFGKMGVSVDDTKAHLASTNPSKRMGLPEEMAKAALFLASDDSSYVVGAELLADGGLGAI